MSLRDEEFGALAYHHGNRRLVFVKSRPLVELLEHLGDYESLEAALGAMVAPAARAQFEAALTSLAASEIIRGD